MYLVSCWPAISTATNKVTSILQTKQRKQNTVYVKETLPQLLDNFIEKQSQLQNCFQDQFQSIHRKMLAYTVTLDATDYVFSSYLHLHNF